MLGMIKTVGKIAVSSGVTLVVNNLIKENIKRPDKFNKKISMAIGIFALSSYVSGKVVKEFEGKFDTFEKSFDNLVSRIKSIKSEEKEA